jgi:hypothetical protein
MFAVSATVPDVMVDGRLDRPVTFPLTRGDPDEPNKAGGALELLPTIVGAAAEVTTRIPNAYRCPATLAYELVSAREYTVVAAANNVVSLAQLATRVRLPLDATE